jgi:tRNA pseudouridine55 synthase
MIGILLIDKPDGLTSHDVVNRVRRGLHTKRVGHAGTLDPIATGLLVLAIGPATRFLQYLPLEPKTYEGVFRFGQTTGTFDTEGEVLEEKPLPDDLEVQVASALEAFRGEISQLPPMYSAVKKDGRALYKYAREGIEVERNPRTVFIKSFDYLGKEGDQDLKFRIVCSGGTYVRTLAHDLGQAVGCGAHVISLRRTGVGEFGIGQAVSLDEIPIARLVPLSQALTNLPHVQLNESQVGMVREGRDVLAKEQVFTKFAALLDESGDVISVAKASGRLLHPECVIPAEAARGGI